MDLLDIMENPPVRVLVVEKDADCKYDVSVPIKDYDVPYGQWENALQWERERWQKSTNRMVCMIASDRSPMAEILAYEKIGKWSVETANQEAK